MSHPAISPRAPRRWAIVGFGRVGQSIALLADRLDATVDVTWNRTEAAARDAVVPTSNPCWGLLPDALGDALDEPCLVWLTVVDEAIEPVVARIADALAPGSFVIHTSGSIPSTVLAAHTELPTASLHPLQAISDPEAALRRFHRTFWTVEGDDDAVDTLRDLIRPAGIEPTRIEPGKKTLYHASAVTSANLLVSLMDAAIAIADAADIDRTTAREMLVELAGSSLENLATQPPSQALTGPAARGDLDVIETHRDALERLDDDSLLKIYELLTDRALQKLAAHDD